MEKKKLQGEQKTEEQLFFIMFKEMIESMGWNYIYMESSLGDKLWFGNGNSIKELMEHGNSLVEYSCIFRDACITLLEIKHQSQFKPATSFESDAPYIDKH